MRDILLYLFLTTFFSQQLFSNGIEYKEPTKNRIINVDGLKYFFNDLHKLDSLSSGVVNIVHIGDSHVQAPFFTSKIRDLLQMNFGNAGFGFSFPYRMAKTNGSQIAKYKSNIFWENTSSILKNDNIGLSGFKLETEQKKFVVGINVNDSKYEFSKIKLFYPKNKDKLSVKMSEYPIMIENKPDIDTLKHKIKKGETLSRIAKIYKTTIDNILKINNLKKKRIIVGKTLNVSITNKLEQPSAHVINESKLQQLQHTETEFFDEFFSKRPLTDVYIVPIDSGKTDKTSDYEINGIVLENNHPGILYHSIGVNGAKYDDYLKNDLFFEQIKGLTPSLIIISLGTNEAFQKKDPNIFINEMNLFINKLKSKIPNISIIITTPPPSLVNKKKENNYTEEYARKICESAKKDNIAVWDLFSQIGGYKEIKNNIKKGYFADDRIHYTVEGYETMGTLFSDAIINAFKSINFKNGNYRIK